MIIYRVTNLINGKIYIGQTYKKLHERKKQHIRRSNYDKYLTYFGKALRKYGEAHFKWEVIDYAVSQEELNKKETWWIEHFDSTNPQKGYNLKGGGDKPYLTSQVKDKISKAQLGKLNHMYGVKGEEHPSSIPVINITNQKCYGSATQCAEVENTSLSKICAVCRGDRNSTNGCIYRYLDKAGNIIEPQVKLRRKSISVINIDTNEVFASIIDAQKQYDGMTKYALVQALKRGNGKCVWKGYRWRYQHTQVQNIADIKKVTRSDAKKVMNIDENIIYESITAVGKNYRNLATALRKGNGECVYRKQRWKIIEKTDMPILCQAKEEIL